LEDRGHRVAELPQQKSLKDHAVTPIAGKFCGAAK
jgi:hypothetical protein